MHFSFFLVIFYSLVAVSLSEGIRWYSTTTQTFAKLMQGIKYADQQAARSKSQKKRKPTKPDPIYLKATGYQVRVQFVTTAVLALCYFFVASSFDAAVAVLPFEPFSILRWITQRGIQTTRPAEASATFIYLLGMLVFRSVFSFLLTIPSLPGLSIWEQAEKATNQWQEEMFKEKS